MTADVIPFPNQRTCFTCEHYAWNAFGNGRCELYDEPIDSEIFAARDCAGYEHS